MWENNGTTGTPYKEELSDYEYEPQTESDLARERMLERRAAKDRPKPNIYRRVGL